MALSPDDAAALYESGKSVCEIAAAHKLTKTGVEDKLRKRGKHGLVWCPIHRMYEAL